MRGTEEGVAVVHAEPTAVSQSTGAPSEAAPLLSTEEDEAEPIADRDLKLEGFVGDVDREEEPLISTKDQVPKDVASGDSKMEGFVGDLNREEKTSSDRPADDEILLQENSIRAEEAQKLEFIGDKEPLSALAVEYERGNEVFRAKIQRLSQTYGSIRRTRGDGNCFFRGFMFAYLERLLHSQDKTELPRMRERIERCKRQLTAVGYQPFTFEDFLEIFMEQLESVLPEEGSPISLEELEARCRDPNVSNWAVMFFRFVTSAEVQRRADFFEPFILGLTNLDVKKFCQTSVEPMGEESDHVHITALTDALGVPVRILYLDRSGGSSDGSLEINHHDFVPETASIEANASDLLTLLYRPGHYDILYSV